ncbi:MAG: hypothetical protein COX48_03160 [bacterium (Candidatus Stahlbacteria) CG23_combo_of_CG06-09_8_20_14_all_34_7]|nr:MAG: hypothetical protein COX48_03160 [bacterium (Candidatus Stahlbacteria) CG23_combo_of_CG06-09_8_20_14_all_34_7]
MIRVDIPPLRERKDDIPQIFNYYVDKFSTKYGKKVTKINADVYNKIRYYKWPGNVREIMNVIERIMVIKSDSIIKAEDLSMMDLSSDKESEHSVKVDTLENTEKEMISRVLQKVNNDKKEASKILGINLSTLYRKLKQYNLDE